MINGLGLYGVIGVVGGIRVHKPKAAVAWWFMAAGLLLFFLGDVYTYSYPKLFHADVPFPSLGDAMYIGVYPVLMVGLLLLVRRRNQRASDGPGVIDSVIMSVGLSLVSFLFLIAPYIHDGSMDADRPSWCRSPTRRATSSCWPRPSGSPSTPASAGRASTCSSPASSRCCSPTSSTGS